MYGLINQGIKDFIILKKGESTWRHICQKLGLSPHKDFDFLSRQNDSYTYDLISSVSTITNYSPDEFLKDFGCYWVKYTASQGYNEVIEIFGKDIPTLLTNLTFMHERMNTMMPKIQPPQFETTILGNNQYKVLYRSSRKGLSPMVEGVILGISKRFKQKIEFTHIAHDKNGKSATFEFMVIT